MTRRTRTTLDNVYMCVCSSGTKEDHHRAIDRSNKPPPHRLYNQRSSSSVESWELLENFCHVNGSCREPAGPFRHDEQGKQQPPPSPRRSIRRKGNLSIHYMAIEKSIERDVCAIERCQRRRLPVFSIWVASEIMKMAADCAGDKGKEERDSSFIPADLMM